MYESLLWECISYSRDELQKFLKTLNIQVSTVLEFYEQNTDTLDLTTCTLRSVTSPSIADMLEWLQDASSYYRQQYPFRNASWLIWLSWMEITVFFPQLRTDSWGENTCCRCWNLMTSLVWKRFQKHGNLLTHLMEKSIFQVPLLNHLDRIIVVLLKCNNRVIKI